MKIEHFRNTIYERIITGSVETGQWPPLVSPSRASMYIKPRTDSAIDFCRLPSGHAAPMSSLRSSFPFLRFSSKFLRAASLCQPSGSLSKGELSSHFRVHKWLLGLARSDSFVVSEKHASFIHDLDCCNELLVEQRTSCQRTSCAKAPLLVM